MNIFDLIRNNNLSDLDKALQANPDLVNLPDEKGFTPLVLATYLGNREIAKLLIERGADLNYQDPMMGMTALMGVSFKGQAALAQLLLEKGADAHLKTKNGETALDFAKKSGVAEIVRLLEA